MQYIDTSTGNFIQQPWKFRVNFPSLAWREQRFQFVVSFVASNGAGLLSVLEVCIYTSFRPVIELDQLSLPRLNWLDSKTDHVERYKEPGFSLHYPW